MDLVSLVHFPQHHQIRFNTTYADSQEDATALVRDTAAAWRMFALSEHIAPGIRTASTLGSFKNLLETHLFFHSFQLST